MSMRESTLDTLQKMKKFDKEIRYFRQLPPRYFYEVTKYFLKIYDIIASNRTIKIYLDKRNKI
jgi:hypothetical protein